MSRGDVFGFKGRSVWTLGRARDLSRWAHDVISTKTIGEWRVSEANRDADQGVAISVHEAKSRPIDPVARPWDRSTKHLRVTPSPPESREGQGSFSRCVDGRAGLDGP